MHLLLLAVELKSGDVAVARSDSYADYREQLLPWNDCVPLLADYCRTLDLPNTAAAFVADLKERLRKATATFDRLFPENDQVRISEQGEQSSSAFRARSQRPLRWRSKRACWGGCTHHFGPLSGANPKLEDPFDAYVRLLFAYGTNMGPVQAARHMGDAISAHSLSYLNRRHADLTKLTLASVDISNTYERMTLAKLWGSGISVAVDGTKDGLADNNPLDDYHLISAPAIHTTVAYLLDHLPDRVCLTIGSRADPPLPLARLRVREQLVELRATQLRFTTEEIQAFFQLVSNLPLSLDEAHAISAYAEGWPAGVQLIALALKSEAQEQVAEVAAAPAPLQRVLARLDASQHHVFAFLADDVFEHQPPHLKSFLLQTAILDRICAPLCDAVLGIAPDERPQTNDEQAFDKLESVSNVIHPLSSVVLRPSSDSYSRLLLEELERANLLIILLDHERHWYRYHHLFHAFLRTRLDCEPPGALAELHRRASVGFECHQFVSSAVEHALAAGDIAHAAELIEGLAMMLIERGEYATLHGWLDRIPETILVARPALCLWAAWAALLAGEVEQIEPLLGRAERAWQAAGDRPRLGEVAHLQAHLARLRHDAEATIAAAQQALAGLAEDALTVRAGSLLALGVGQFFTGDLVAAATSLQAAYLQCQAHNFLGMLVALRFLGDLAVQRGQLGEAARNYRDVIQAVGERAVWERWAAAIRLGDLSRERNDLDGALETLRAAMTAAEQAGVAVYLPYGYIALARTLAAQQDFVAAEAALDRATYVAHRLGSPAHIRQIRAYRARLALASKATCVFSWTRAR